jgi:hypothetical protein
MARPKLTGLEYFPHDSAASSDAKIEAMRHLYGNDGYAFYFIILERIYAQGCACLDLSDGLFATILRKKIGVEFGLFEEMIATSCKLGLFDKSLWESSKVLTSKRIMETRNAVEKERKRKRGRMSEKLRNNSGETAE